MQSCTKAILLQFFFVHNLSFSWCPGRAMIRECGTDSWVSSHLNVLKEMLCPDSNVKVKATGSVWSIYTPVISTSLISNNSLSRSENLAPV